MQWWWCIGAVERIHQKKLRVWTYTWTSFGRVPSSFGMLPFNELLFICLFPNKVPTSEFLHKLPRMTGTETAFSTSKENCILSMNNYYKHTTYVFSRCSEHQFAPRRKEEKGLINLGDSDSRSCAKCQSFAYRCWILVRPPKEEGTGPEMWFWSIWILLSCDKLPSDGGRMPVRLFPFSNLSHAPPIDYLPFCNLTAMSDAGCPKRNYAERNMLKFPRENFLFVVAFRNCRRLTAGRDLSASQTSMECFPSSCSTSRLWQQPHRGTVLQLQGKYFPWLPLCPQYSNGPNLTSRSNNEATNTHLIPTNRDLRYSQVYKSGKVSKFRCQGTTKVELEKSSAQRTSLHVSVDTTLGRNFKSSQIFQTWSKQVRKVTSHSWMLSTFHNWKSKGEGGTHNSVTNVTLEGPEGGEQITQLQPWPHGSFPFQLFSLPSGSCRPR